MIRKIYAKISRTIITGIRPKGVPEGKKIAYKFKRCVKNPTINKPPNNVKANDYVKIISAVVVVEYGNNP